MSPSFIVYLIVITFLYFKSVYAVDTVNLGAGSISGRNWKLEDVKLGVNRLNKNEKFVAISTTKLILPKPFNQSTFVNIKCEQFIWREGEIICNKGWAQVQTKNWQTLTTDFNFHLTNTKSVINLIGIKIGGSVIKIKGEFNGQQWQVAVKSERLSYPVFEKLAGQFAPRLKIPKPTQGKVDLDALISGRGSNPLSVSLTAKVNNLTVQTADGKLAAEKLDLLTHLTAIKSSKVNNEWHWQSESEMGGGALYAEPVYLEANQVSTISLKAEGNWQIGSNRFEVSHFAYNHPGVGRLAGSTQGIYRDKIEFKQTEARLTSQTLQPLITAYVQPFFAESQLTGMTVAGSLQGDFAFTGQRLTKAAVQFANVDIDAKNKRFKVNKASGSFNWSENSAVSEHSQIRWQGLTIQGVPVDSAGLNLESLGRQFRLTEKTKLPVLNGSVDIDRFDWRAKPGDEPEVTFIGKIKDISLEQLTKALGWMPLSGNISGEIPGVKYHNKTLSLDGELLVNVFDGKVKVNNLSSSGLFGDFPKLKADISVDNLDMEKLTRKFDFGSITGRLTGFVNDLQLENWRPVSFFAWFGTPESDDSSHKISQKAVNNIAQIGGGGATDLLSRSFLGFFDTFRYSRIGIGCYLHNGVCQMSGVEAAEQGYYLIKGGCLPRIDVMGYNTQVNWDVLVERLARVASPDKAIVQ